MMFPCVLWLTIVVAQNHTDDVQAIVAFFGVVITMAFSIPFPARTKVAIVLVLHTRLFYL
jgi:hypothetical protein